MKIWILRIDHKYGTNTSVWSTYDKAYLELLAYVKDCIDDENLHDQMTEVEYTDEWVMEYFILNDETCEISDAVLDESE